MKRFSAVDVPNRPAGTQVKMSSNAGDCPGRQLSSRLFEFFLRRLVGSTLMQPK
jgi:hypothetical protein